jgi:hypothetical protein
MKTIDYKGCTIEVQQDECPMDPRKNYSNLGAFIGTHRRYTVGDGEGTVPWGRLKSVRAVKRWLSLYEDAAIVLPVYMYEHSGRVWRLGSDFRDSDYFDAWDSGIVGVMYVTKADMLKEYEAINEETKAKAAKVLQGELNMYAAWAEGDVWGFSVKDEDGDDLGSYWGFYGFDHDYMISEAQSAINFHLAQKAKPEFFQAAGI